MQSSGIPDAMIEQMKASPAWPSLLALAHTLAYDVRLLNEGVVPTERLGHDHLSRARHDGQPQRALGRRLGPRGGRRRSPTGSGACSRASPTTSRPTCWPRSCASASVWTAVSRVFVTGSADGLGRLAAAQLVGEGHEVVLHARSEARGREALDGVPGAAGVLTGDLASIAQTRALAERANAGGRFDAVIHNAALGYQVSRPRPRPRTASPPLFAVNVLAPYLLTALMTRPDRLVYLSSGMHTGGDPALVDLQWRDRRWNGVQAYSDSKLFDLVLAFAVARRWPDVRANAVTPGWVATQDGRAGRARRPGAGRRHPGVAGGLRRARGAGERPLPLSPHRAPGRSGGV